MVLITKPVEQTIQSGLEVQDTTSGAFKMIKLNRWLLLHFIAMIFKQMEKFSKIK